MVWKRNPCGSQYATRLGQLNGDLTPGRSCRLSDVGVDGDRFCRVVVGARVVCSQLPPAEEIYSRFGVGKNWVSRSRVLPGVKFAMADDEVVVFIGQENLVREQKSGVMESMLASGFAAAQTEVSLHGMGGGHGLRAVARRCALLAAGPGAASCRGGDDRWSFSSPDPRLGEGPGRLTEFTAAYHRVLDEFAQRTRRVVLLSPLPLRNRGLPTCVNSSQPQCRRECLRGGGVGRSAAQRGAVFVRSISRRSSTAARFALGQAPVTGNGIHRQSRGWSGWVAEIASRKVSIWPRLRLRVCVRRSSAKTSCGRRLLAAGELVVRLW